MRSSGFFWIVDYEYSKIEFNWNKTDFVTNISSSKPAIQLLRIEEWSHGSVFYFKNAYEIEIIFIVDIACNSDW